MGLLDKMKNLFTDEIEEEPIKSEMIQVEIPAPAKVEETKNDSVTDSSILEHQEEKISQPIFFDDNYFKELEKPKEPVKSSYLKEPKPSNEKKVFKPTPIISPVYGVLDKNYSKEDIKPKKEKVIYQTNTTVTLDEVRKKAFGTLEDELETTLFGNNSILFQDIPKEPELLEDVEEPDLFEDITKSDDELLEDLKSDPIEEINIVEEEMDKPKEDFKESELFDLIDSMYEKGE